MYIPSESKVVADGLEHLHTENDEIKESAARVNHNLATDIKAERKYNILTLEGDV